MPGDDVLTLGNGVIGEMADIAGIRLDPSQQGPLVESLGSLVGAFGVKEVLRDNPPLRVPVLAAADLAERSGVCQKLDRTLWSVDHRYPPLDAVISTGGVANWQDRTTQLLVKRLDEVKDPQPNVFVLSGDRIMNSSTETENGNVRAYLEEFGEYPSETDYADFFVVPKLQSVGYTVYHDLFDKMNGEQIATEFARINRSLWYPEMTIGFARAATAGLQLALQFRSAIQRLQHFDAFDSQPDNPQVVVLTDGIDIARNEEQLKDARHYQSPYTALRQAALTAKLLLEAEILR